MSSLVSRIAAIPPERIGGKHAHHIAVTVAALWTDEAGDVDPQLLHAEIGAACGLSRSTVMRSMRALVDVGVMVGEYRFSLDAIATAVRQPDASCVSQTHEARHRRASARRIVRQPDASDGLRQGDAMRQPDASTEVPCVSQTHRASARRIASNSRGTSQSPPPPAFTSKEEEEGARAMRPADASDDSGAVRQPDASEWTPTQREMAYLQWVIRSMLPIELPNGTDLRRDWCAVLRHMRSPEADAVRARMRGDLPSDFARAIGDDLAAVLKQRVADVAKDDGAALAEARLAAARKLAAQEAQDECNRTEAAQKRKDEAETGTLLEQARVLIAAVDADPKRAAGMLNRTAAMMTSLRTAVAAGRVPGHLLGPARISWNETRALPEPAPRVGERTDPPPPNPDHPAAPDRDHPLVLLDDDAPPVDEDPVVTALYGFLSQRGVIVVPDVADAWLAHLVDAGAAMTSTDALAYLGLAFQVAAQRGILVAYPSDIPSQALIAWAALANDPVPA